jgi:hypothetical protein
MPIDPSAQRKIQSLGDEIVQLHKDHEDQVAAQADQVKKQVATLKAKKDQILDAQKKRATATNQAANANTSTAGGAHHDTGLSTGNEQVDVTVAIDAMLNEKLAAGGFNYEKEVNDKLKKMGKAHKDSGTAGSSADAPDAKFNHNGKEHNLEVKQNSKAMFGQIELHHDGKKWDISERSKKKYPHTTRAIQDTGFLHKVNKQWDKPTGDYESDLQKGNVYHTHHDAEPIKAHYGKDRKTDYIQIGGGHGFYHTGKDSAKLGSPELHGKATLRARMKARGTDRKTGKRKYGALIVMGLKDADKSHHNLDETTQKHWINDALNGHVIFESVLNPQDPHKDYQAKRKALHDLSLNKDVDQRAVQQRRLDLDKEYAMHTVKESDASWAAAKEKEKEDRLIPKDKKTLDSIRAMLAKEKKPVKESSDINELSTDLLAAYKTKAATSAREADASGNYAKGDKRFKGINKATTKQFDNDLKKHGQYQKEEVELEEAHKIGDKVIIHKGPKDVVGKTGHVGEIRKRWAGDTKTYTIDHDAGSIQLKSTHFKAVKENTLDWGSILNEDAKSFVDAFWSGQQEEPKKNPYAEGTEEYFQYENGYMQGVMKRRVMQTEAIDKEHPIHKEYESLKKHDIKTLRSMISQQHKIVDTSEFRSKDHAASHILRNRHGDKKVSQVFGLKEEGEGAVPANNAGDGKIAGFAGDAGKKVKMMSQPLRRKPLPKFKTYVSQEHDNA